MNGRVLHFEASDHRRADLLLPWFVNGSLEGDELAFVRRHVGDCARCRREVEWLHELAMMCADARARGMPLDPIAERSGARVHAGWREAVSLVWRAWRRSEAWTRYAIALQFCMIVAVGGALLATRDSPTPYRTLGSTPATGRDAGSIAVVFDPQATEGEMRRIVSAAGARIVDGPTQTNAYVLALPHDRVDASLSMLQSQRAVLLAAPLSATR